MTKLECITQELKESFWGDYNYNPQEALALLNNQNEEFSLLLINKIISNSTFPSKSLSILFEKSRLQELLKKITPNNRAKQRLQLINGILFNAPAQGVPSWI